MACLGRSGRIKSAFLYHSASGGRGREAGEFRSRNNNRTILPFFRGSAELFAGGSRADLHHHDNNLGQNLSCFELELAAVPETLVHTILILLELSAILMQQRRRGTWAHPTHSGAAHGHPWTLLGTHESGQSI